MVVRAEKKINFCVPRGPPPRGAAEPGPPRHAKIGKNGTVTVNDLNQRRYIKKFTSAVYRIRSNNFLQPCTLTEP